MQVLRWRRRLLEFFFNLLLCSLFRLGCQLPDKVPQERSVFWEEDSPNSDQFVFFSNCPVFSNTPFTTWNSFYLFCFVWRNSYFFGVGFWISEYPVHFQLRILHHFRFDSSFSNLDLDSCSICTVHYSPFGELEIQGWVCFFLLFFCFLFLFVVVVVLRFRSQIRKNEYSVWTLNWFRRIWFSDCKVAILAGGGNEGKSCFFIYGY